MTVFSSRAARDVELEQVRRRKLLEYRIKESGMSTRRFAREVLLRGDRKVRRMLQGEWVPQVVADRLDNPGRVVMFCPDGSAKWFDTMQEWQEFAARAVRRAICPHCFKIHPEEVRLVR